MMSLRLLPYSDALLLRASFKSWAWPCANKADTQKHSQLSFALFGRSAERTGRHQPPHTNGRPNSAASVACVWMTQLGTCVIPEVTSTTSGQYTSASTRSEAEP